MDPMFTGSRSRPVMTDRKTVLGESSYTKVFIGEIRVGKAPEVMVTALGSCVGIVLYDKVNGVGGLAHVMLADSNGAEVRNKGKYADTAIPEMIRMAIKEGAFPGGVAARIAGGASMYETPHGCSNIGKCNIDAVKTLLGKNNIPIIGEDVGGTESRTLKVDLQDGSVTIYSAGKQKIVM